MWCLTGVSTVFVFLPDQGLVEMEDSDRDGHLVTVDVKSAASSESELSRVVIIHRIVEASDMKSILIVQAVRQLFESISIVTVLKLAFFT